MFRDLVLARIIEPTSKADSLRVLAETGVSRPVVSDDETPPAGVRQPGCARHYRRRALPMPGSGRRRWCSTTSRTLYFETDAGDGFREPGFSKERRLEPQITVGLLTDAAGFPLTVEAFEGNNAETDTMLPVHQRLHDRPSGDGRHRRCGCRDDLGGQPERDRGRRAVVHPGRPDPRRALRGRPMADKHPDQEIPDGQIFTQPWPAPVPRRPAESRIGSSTTSTGTTGPGAACAASTSRSPRPRTLSTGKARSNATGSSSSPGPPSRVNRDLEAKARALAGLKGYTTNLTGHRRVRHRRLPPAVAHREELPDVQARPTSPADLPPQTRVDRSPPDHRVRRLS